MEGKRRVQGGRKGGDGMRNGEGKLINAGVKWILSGEERTKRRHEQKSELEAGGRSKK